MRYRSAESYMGLRRVLALVAAALGFAAVIAGCDGSSPDTRDLINRVEVASHGYDDMQIDSLNNIVEVDGVQQLNLLPITDGVVGIESLAESGTWSSRNKNVATVDRAGLVTGVADGSVVIDSRFGPLSASITLEVSSAVLTSIEIEPSAKSIDECDSLQFVARGIYAANDGASRIITDEVDWRVATESTAGYFSDSDPKGLLRSSNTGTVNVVASLADDAITQAVITVLDNLNGIEIPESSSTLTISKSVQFGAQASYEGDTDGSTLDITNNASWSVDNTAIATIGNTLPSKGLLNTRQNGSVTMTATCGGFSGTLTVLSGEPDVINSLRIDGNNPLTLDYQEPETRNLKSFATLQNGLSVEITEDSDWIIVAPGHPNFVLNNNANFKGQLAVSGRGVIEVEVRYIGDDYEFPSDVSVNVPRLKIEVR